MHFLRIHTEVDQIRARQTHKVKMKSQQTINEELLHQVVAFATQKCCYNLCDPVRAPVRVTGWLSIVILFYVSFTFPFKPFCWLQNDMLYSSPFCCPTNRKLILKTKKTAMSRILARLKWNCNKTFWLEEKKKRKGQNRQRRQTKRPEGAEGGNVYEIWLLWLCFWINFNVVL